jgi:hypothetical protein
MRVLVFAFIAGVAGFMAWLWFQPVCKGGTVLADEMACARTVGYTADFCRRAFSNSKQIAQVSGARYPTLWECNQAWPKCMERGPTGEAVPVPTSWCIVRSADGKLQRLTPQYDNYRQ